MIWFWQNLPLHKLPGVFSVDIQAPTEPGEPVHVNILLKGYRRADVAKWAAHLGSEVVEGDLRRDALGDWERPVETVREAKGFRVAVRTTVPVKGDPDLSGLPWRVYAQPAEGERWLANAFSTRERAERFVEQHPTRYGPLTIKRADESAEAEPAAVHWPAPGLRITTWCEGEPLTAESFAARESAVTCPQCRELLPAAAAEPAGGASC